VIIGANIIALTNETLARTLLGILISSVGIYTIFKKEYGEENRYYNSGNYKIFSLTLVFISGVLNGSLSAGTGLLFTIILISIYKMDYKNAIAYTLIVVGFFYNSIGAITLGMLTEINWNILPVLFIGSLIGGYVGARMSLSKSNQTIKIIYQIVTISVGISLIY